MENIKAIPTFDKEEMVTRWNLLFDSKRWDEKTFNFFIDRFNNSETNDSNKENNDHDLIDSQNFSPFISSL